MGNQRVDLEDQETLFRPSNYKPALYFVQSPSTNSHANSHTATDLYHVPHHTESLPFYLPYSSSRGSNGSYLHEKKITRYENDENRPIEQDYGYDDNDLEFEDVEEEEEEDGWMSLFSFSTYPSSTLWICLQILWRLIVSFGVALLVFYIATKPPPPHVSVEIEKIGEFGLGEGVDTTGVTTILLSINCSVILSIKNKSKFFGLHIDQSPAITMSFGHLPLVTAYGPDKLCARSDDSTMCKLIVATRNMPMYGGGRDMQDMLDLNSGFPLVVQFKMKSEFRIVWGLISPKFYHKAECLLLLGRAYDKKHNTHTYKSRCHVLS